MISGGTNNSNVITGSASSLNADVITSTDVSYVENIQIQLTGTWVGTVSFQGSNDNSNWVSVLGQSTTTVLNGPVSIATTNDIFVIPANFSFFRLRITSYTSGTVSASVIITENSPVSLFPININANITNSSFEISNDAGNAIPVSLNSTDRLGTGTISTLNGTYAVNTQGMSTVMFEITGVWNATIGVEITLNGSTWNAVECYDEQTDLRLSTITSNRVVKLVCGGFAQVRLKATSYTSGTISIASDAAIGLNAPDSSDTIRNNSTPIPPQSQLVAGSDGINLIPLAVDSSGRLITSAITGFGADFAFGDITTATLTRVLVKRTTYTEQTTNGQRSIASASASDAAAGIGARTVKITYLDQTGAGPYIELLTLNGTTGVNTVATNICYIEQIEVLTAGSTGSNAGIITLYTAINKGGSVIGTISATNNQTFWAHHYVPINKTCNITGISCGHNGTTVGSGALFTINAKNLSDPTMIETQVSDFVRLYGQTSTFSRNYASPIIVVGPSRLQIYVTPETSSSTTYRAAFDFFEP